MNKTFQLIVGAAARTLLVFAGMAVTLSVGYFVLASLAPKTHGAIISALGFVFAIVNTLLLAGSKSIEDLAETKALSGAQHAELVRLIHHRRKFLNRAYVCSLVANAIAVLCSLWLINETPQPLVANRLLIVGYSMLGFAIAGIVIALQTQSEAVAFRNDLRLKVREDEERERLVMKLKPPSEPPPSKRPRSKKLTGIISTV